MPINLYKMTNSNILKQIKKWKSYKILKNKPKKT